MASKALLVTIVSLWLVHQDGGEATAILCKPRKAIPVTMTHLSEVPWHLAAHIDSLPSERHESCVTTTYQYNPLNDEFLNIRSSMAEGTNDTIVSKMSDVFNTTTPGVFEMIPRNTEGVVVKVSFLQYTPGDSFVTNHCEIRDGKLYTDRLTVAFKNRNVDPEKIRQKYESIGINNYTNEWLIPQINCKD